MSTSTPILHLSTLLARSCSSLHKYIASVADKYGNKGHTCLFALSANFGQAQELEDVVKRLTHFNHPKNTSARHGHGTGGRTVGCLTDSFNTVDFSEFNSAFSANGDPILSCSIAVLPASSCIPFHSDLPGKSQPQVGRWHSFRKKGGDDIVAEDGELDKYRNQTGEMSWEDVWNETSSGSASPLPLPKEFSGTSSSRMASLVYFTTPHPSLFLKSIDASLPHVNKLGLVAAPTHFVTGRAVTLFYDDQILEDGTVGLALLKSGEDGRGPGSVSVDFLGAQKLGGPLTVTSAEGNMINSLNSSNPTQLLLSAIDLAGVDKSSQAILCGDDQKFFLGVVSPTGQVSRTYKITAGDPSSRSGTLSLDASQAPKEGTVVQFLYRRSSAPQRLPVDLITGPQSFSEVKYTLGFVSVPESLPASASDWTDSTAETTLMVRNTFLSPSTAGFFLGRGGMKLPVMQVPGHTIDPVHTKEPADSWRCSVVGGVGLFHWRR